MTATSQIPEQELSFAGTIVDKAIEHMVGQNIRPIAIASALLGGAVGLLCQTLPDDVIVQILRNAIESVESGEMRHNAGKDHAGEA
jgi:ABC-type enterochelin transport system permease subunit